VEEITARVSAAVRQELQGHVMTTRHRRGGLKVVAAVSLAFGATIATTGSAGAQVEDCKCEVPSGPGLPRTGTKSLLLPAVQFAAIQRGGGPVTVEIGDGSLQLVGLPDVPDIVWSPPERG
jgi:hypothetical protein